jgi:ribose-phosphate pyrophosphokinase
MSLILGFDDYLTPAQQLAKRLSLPFKRIALHRFPDGETKVTLPTSLPKEVIICRTLNRPNEKLVELIISAAAAKMQGVERLTLVAPYLCYMRQDIAFAPGEAISQKIVGKLLSEYFDGVITVDPHLHRIQHLSEAIPHTQAITLYATSAMAAFLKQHFTDPVLIGPDEESVQWVKSIAKVHHWHYAIANKQRFGDNKVEVSFPANLSDNRSLSLKNRDVIIVDDIASTGKTLEQTALQIRQQEPSSISVIITHAFFPDDVITRLGKIGVDNIWSSDSVLHSSNAYSIVDTIAKQLRSPIL